MLDIFTVIPALMSLIVAAVVFRLTRSESLVLFALVIPFAILFIGVYLLPKWFGVEEYWFPFLFVIVDYIAAAIPSLLVLTIGKALKRRPTIY
jgi:hypothetical protein